VQIDAEETFNVEKKANCMAAITIAIGIAIATIATIAAIAAISVRVVAIVVVVLARVFAAAAVLVVISVVVFTAAVPLFPTGGITTISVVQHLELLPLHIVAVDVKRALGFVARPLRRIGVAGRGATGRGVRAAAVAGTEYAGGWTAGGGAASASLEPPGRSAKKERNRVGWERERERERERACDGQRERKW
jgi:uncharacterized membrane protein YgcG